jgi:tRNA pseudouridine32 synthase/23S rRNA pseudouridine746 synthase
MDGSLAGAGVAVIHADEAILVVDKPSGLLSVPAKPPGPQVWLLVRVEAEWRGARLVHRMYRDTSGVMVFGRSALSQRHLNWQFERRQVAKSYVARVVGEVVGEAGRIDLPLICDWPNRPLQMVCHARGKAAVTDWEVIGREPGATRLGLRPLTGRSHQLRVHLQAMGHAILGDPFYGVAAALAAADRMQLHAESLAFRHPHGGARVAFRAEAPF